MDSTTFNIVQKKLAFEKVGRKKNLHSRNPFFNLCYSCGSYLLELNGMLTCPSCNKSVDSTKIVEKIKSRMVEIITKQCDFDDYIEESHINNIMEEESEQLRKLKILISKLQKRLEEIKDLDINKEVKSRMIQTNTEEIKKLFIKKGFIETKIEYFQKPTSDAFRKAFFDNVKECLISTPFIILYNFFKKEVVIVPHKNVFTKEDL